MADREPSFYEDRLPTSQHVIETSNVRRFRWLLKTIRDPNRESPTIATAVGEAGIGKSIAVRSTVDELPAREHTALPAGVVVKVKPALDHKGFGFRHCWCS